MFLSIYMILLLCMGNIDKATWQRLYESARTFRQLAPWEWMYDTDLFGVKDPETGEIGYCCIMGHVEQFIGMAVYRGRAGLASYERLQEVNVDHPMIPPSAAFEQDCLMLSFKSREELSPQDHLRIRDLGMKFRGKSHWPSFQDYSPGMTPWPITDEANAQFLIVAIEQAIHVAQRCKIDQDLLDHVEDAAPCLLVRTPREGEWHDEWVPVGPFQPEKPPIQISKLFLRSNAQDLPKGEQIWLADIFYFPNPVQDGEDRPYLPIMLILVDYGSGMIVGHGVFQPKQIEQELQQLFTNTIRSAGYIPSRLLVPSLEAVAYWQDICAILGIALELDEDLPLIGDIKLSLFGSMSL